MLIHSTKIQECYRLQVYLVPAVLAFQIAGPDQRFQSQSSSWYLVCWSLCQIEFWYRTWDEHAIANTLTFYRTQQRKLSLLMLEASGWAWLRWNKCQNIASIVFGYKIRDVTVSQQRSPSPHSDSIVVSKTFNIMWLTRYQVLIWINITEAKEMSSFSHSASDSRSGGKAGKGGLKRLIKKPDSDSMQNQTRGAFLRPLNTWDHVIWSHSLPTRNQHGFSGVQPCEHSYHVYRITGLRRPVLCWNHCQNTELALTISF